MKNPTAWKGFRTAAWLGWQIESNWADPLLFSIYSVAKPLGAAGIVVVMYAVITRGNFGSPLFPCLYVGQAFYLYVASLMSGISFGVIDDRERYRTLKYVYVAPPPAWLYLLGRGTARLFVGTVSVAITLLVGVLFLHLPLHPSQVNLPLFLLSLVLGLSMLAMLGLLLAGVTLNIAHHSDFLGEAVAGALYLVSGAVFPIDILPRLVRPLGFVFPISWWLELTRRSLLGREAAAAFPTFHAFSTLQVSLGLAGTALGWGLIAAITFRLCEQSARERGLIDRVTNY